jgi:hypothetical protein
MRATPVGLRRRAALPAAPVLRMAGWQQESDFDPEDPWEKAAFDALEAQRRKLEEEEERVASDEGVAVG